MKLKTFLTLGLFGLATALPIAETSTNPANALTKRETDYELVCPPVVSSVSASECFRRFRTYCRSDGYMENFTTGYRPQICTYNVCYCERNENAVLPGFYNPENIGAGPGYLGFGSNKEVEEEETKD